jgi:GNAT superfamily N-acetyltransferase
MIHGFLAASYWAVGRSRAAVERSIANSVCFGGYVWGCQVAFGRIITDTVAVAYLADVFVLAEWRGRGYGKELVSAMLSYIDATDVKSTLLRTQDAQGLYERFGFQPLPEPIGFMRRPRPEIPGLRPDQGSARSVSNPGETP